MTGFLKLTASIIICELTGILATPFTLTAIPTWYADLNKPFFSPPNWLFGPVWTTLYFLMGVSVFLIWNKGLNKKGIQPALLLFLTQLFFNFVWSVLFFGLHSPILGLIDILILWPLIVMTFFKFRKISKLSSYLLIPYLFWVSFAVVLNLAIVILNT